MMALSPRVLVTRRWPEAVELRLKANYDVVLNATDTPLSVAELQRGLQDFDAVLPTVTDPFGADVFKAPNIRAKIIGNFGVGFSHIDVTAATRSNIVVTNTPDVLSDCTADIAMTVLLMVARRAGEGERELREGKWAGWCPTHMIGEQVTGKTLGIIGFGRIGQEMARRAHFGFGMTILAQSRRQIPQDSLKEFKAQQVNTLEELIPQCDFISLHCPGGEVNRHLINAERLSLMKARAFLINTARGEIVDEAALAEALYSGRIGGAALDVFDGEPNINPALMAAPRLVMLPHLGSATRSTREAMGFRVMDNLNAFFNGKCPPDQVA